MEWIETNIGCALELMMIVVCIYIAWDIKIQFNFWLCCIFIINGICSMLINTGKILEISNCIVYLLLWLYCYLYLKRKIVETIARFLGAITVAALIEILAAFILVFLENGLNLNTRGFVLINTISVFVAFALYVLKIRSKDRNNYMINIKLVRRMFICTVPIIILLMDYALHHELNVKYDILIFVLVIGIYYFLLKITVAENELKKKKLELELERVYGCAYKELVHEVRQRQHDFKNQLTAVYSMHLTATTLEELRMMQSEYCQKLTEKSCYDDILMNCNDSILAGYLYCKCINCDKLGIEVDYEIHIDSAECCIALYELIEIIGIFIDNACEHVIVNMYNSKKIVLKVYEEKTIIVVKVANVSEFYTSQEIEKMFQPGYSTKGDNRGLGLARAKEIVKQYNLELMVFNSMIDNTNWFNINLKIQK